MTRSVLSDLSSWLKTMPDMAAYAMLFDENGATLDLLLCVESDDPLKELGMASEVDRKYLLLQLARAAKRLAESQVHASSAVVEAELEGKSLPRHPAGDYSIEMEALAAQRTRSQHGSC